VAKAQSGTASTTSGSASPSSQPEPAQSFNSNALPSFNVHT
jgi:hypothetical protein